MAPSENSSRSSNRTSSLLQDALREKKAQTQRVKKTYDAHDGHKDGLGDREVQSSPLTTREKPGAQSRRVNGVNLRQPSLPKEMGVKEMEQHLSKVNKQNFDLKLEVFHCRQRNEALKAKVERFDALEADNAEVQSINEDLLLELEKRDVAIQEAVNLICELEAKIEEMGEAEMYFRESSGTPRPAVPNTGADNTVLSAQSDQQRPGGAKDLPPRSDTSSTRRGNLSPEPENFARRIPSFLRDNKKNTNVLRSLYSFDGSVGGPGSIFSGDDTEDDEDGIAVNSPRLSVLSESGFMSVYGDPDDSERVGSRQKDENAVPRRTPSQGPQSPSPRDNQREARLQKWVEESERPVTPSRPSSKGGMNDRFSSIGEILQKVPSTAKDNGDAGHDSSEQKPRQARNPAESERKEARGHQRRPSSPAFGGPMFGGAMLPPTPGTMSTATIAGSSSTPSIVTEKSLLDGTPLPAKGYTALIPDARPQTSDSNLAIRLGNALAAEGETSRDPESPLSNRSSRASRPSFKTHATDTVFSGEGYATIQHSRTLSYPSPTGRARRPSGQLSPTSEKSAGERSLSSRTQNGQRSPTVTPTKDGAQKSQPRSPRASQHTPTSTTGPSKSQVDSKSKPGRSATLRNRINKLTPSQTAHQSVASRLFRRANSHTAPAPPSAQQNPTAVPPPARKTSPTRHARLPRPSSLYGSSPIYGQRPLPPTPNRPSSSRNNQREREHTCDSHRNYQLPPILPVGMLTDDSRSSSPRHSRQR